MAKFKVGDKVRVSEKVRLEGIPHDGWNVLHVLTDGRYAVVHDKPEGWSRKPILDVFEHELAFNSAHIASTNAVVQEALNSACARNERFKKGDLVKMSHDKSNSVWRIDEDYGDGYYRIVKPGSMKALSAPSTLLKAANTEPTANAFSPQKGIAMHDKVGHDLRDLFVAFDGTLRDMEAYLDYLVQNGELSAEDTRAYKAQIDRVSRCEAEMGRIKQSLGFH